MSSNHTDIKQRKTDKIEEKYDYNLQVDSTNKEKEIIMNNLNLGLITLGLSEQSAPEEVVESKNNNRKCKLENENNNNNDNDINSTANQKEKKKKKKKTTLTIKIQKKKEEYLVNHPMNFVSQVAQDEFVYILSSFYLPKENKKYFLEIGAGPPKMNSNTYILEQTGQWEGISIDLANHLSSEWKELRPYTHFVETNALKVENWVELIEKKFEFPLTLDYLSLDIDENQLSFVENKFPWDKIKFRILTVEHDSYRFGMEVANKIRNKLTGFGYQMVVKDIMNESSEFCFEDWWIHPDLLFCFLEKEKNKDDRDPLKLKEKCWTNIRGWAVTSQLKEQIL